jgi:hypothetical protein
MFQPGLRPRTGLVALRADDKRIRENVTSEVHVTTERIPGREMD